MKTVLLDTNVLVRFTTGEPVEQAEQARQLLISSQEGNSHLLVLPMVLAEAVYVLTKVYALPRHAVTAALSNLLSSPGFQSDESRLMTGALELFGRSRLGFLDCYLANTSLHEGLPIATFDHEIRKLSGVKWIQPGNLQD